MPMQPHVQKFIAGWSDMDWNAHMANTAYLNKTVDARVLVFKELGLTLEEFTKLRIGVVTMKDELEYRREIKWMEEFTVTVALDGLAADGSRFKARHEFFRGDGQLAARVTTVCGFMDLLAEPVRNFVFEA